MCIVTLEGSADLAFNTVYVLKHTMGHLMQPGDKPHGVSMLLCFRMAGLSQSTVNLSFQQAISVSLPHKLVQGLHLI